MRAAQLFRNGNAIRVLRPFWDSSRAQKFGGSPQNEKSETLQADPYEGNYSFAECDQYTKVSVIGAAGRVGKTLSLLLKTCPLIDHLCLFDTDKSVKGVGVDISHIDTKCNVSYVCGMRNIQQALNAPDVVVIAAGCPASPNLNGKKLFEKNAPIIAGISEACARFCPKACIILITSPINSLLPVVGSVYQIITNKIPSRRLFGLTNLDVVRANTFVAEVVRKDPSNVIVPVIGGTSQDTIVPVLSQMKPCCKIKRGETVALTECLKRAEENLMDCQHCGTRSASSLSTAYAGFRFTSSLVMALKGAENVIECAFVKSDVIPELEYLASPLKLGIRGIEYNFGYPRLSDYEVVALQQSVPVLISDIEMGKTFVANIQDTIQKGLIWKRLTDESGKGDECRDEIRGKDLLKRRRPEEKRQKLPMMETEEDRDQPRTLKQEVYSQGVRNWAAQASLERFFGGGGHVRENCNEITADSILDSGTCRDDPSLQVEKPLEEFSEEKPVEETVTSLDSSLIGHKPPVRTADFRQKVPGHYQFARMYHSSSREGNGSSNRQRKYFADSKKMLIPIGTTPGDWEAYRRKIRRYPMGRNSLRANQCKNLNASAKQKYRSFNIQKKFMPSASVLLLLDKKKRERAGKNMEIVVAEVKPKKVEEKKSEGTKTEEEDENKEDSKDKKSEDKQVMIRKEQDRYRDFIFKQLQELKKENEELKKRLSKLSEDRRLESVLQSQSDRLELERTKLKACWLIMSSTMDAFSNFCKKFTGKPETKEANEQEEDEKEDEEFDDALESLEEESAGDETKGKEKKTARYDEKYFKFLQKLMEDQIENQLDDCKRNRMRK